MADAPFYDAHVFCCTNTRPPGHPRGCCSEKGSEKLRAYMKSRARALALPKARINIAGCLDRCELGPTMVIYPEGVWYRYENEADIDEILETHLKGGCRVSRLMLDPRRLTDRLDTIFAEATAPGRAGISVLRLSGPEAGRALTSLAGPLPAPRRAVLRAVRDPESGELLDRGLAVWFPGPASFTGEDAAELHLHGAPVVMDAVQAALMRIDGLRPAESGEFARRAFDAGRMDLTAVEGLAELISAETEGQRRQALHALGGGLARQFEGWRERLVQALAHIEAAIDFSDEELPEGLEAEVSRTVGETRAEMTEALAAGARGDVVRDGFRVALVGAPNAGKSSLFNALAAREVAIVSPGAGTTRDVLEARLALGGHLVRLIDMAGFHESDDPVEREGMRRARAEAESADLRLLLAAPGVPAPPDMPGLVVRTKADLGAAPGGPSLAVSARTGEGLESLRRAITEAVRARVAGPPGAFRARHVHALAESAGALDRFAAAPQIDLAAEDLRLAVRALGRVTGRVDVEDLLDVIFGEFCIGK